MPPAMQEHYPSKVFVEAEHPPHSQDAEAERDAEQVGQPDSHRPHENHPDIEGEIDVAGTLQDVDEDDVDGATDFKQNVNPQDGDTQRDDGLIVCKPMHYRTSREGEEQRETERDDHRSPANIAT